MGDDDRVVRKLFAEEVLKVSLSNLDCAWPRETGTKAGKGAKPIASLDVFCFGPPDTHESDIRAKDVIHPLGIMRGVVRGVRDYGNRMGIPTTSGAIAFDKTYIYNPLVFCGTMGLIPIASYSASTRCNTLRVASGWGLPSMS